MKKLSQNLKLFIAISVLWIIFAYIFIILDVRYPDSEEYLEFLLFTAPVWISWLAYWIWGDNFVEFLNRLRSRIGFLRKQTSSKRTKEFTENNISPKTQQNSINQISESTEPRNVDTHVSLMTDSNNNSDNVSAYTSMRWLKFLAVLYLVNIILSILNPSIYAEILSGIDGYSYSLGTFLVLCILPLFIAFLRFIFFSKPRNREFLTATNYLYLFLVFLFGILNYISMMYELEIGVFYYFDWQKILEFLATHAIFGLVFLGFPIFYIIYENRKLKQKQGKSKKSK